MSCIYTALANQVESLVLKVPNCLTVSLSCVPYLMEEAHRVWA